jgi:NTP pyrophosphatase (non-canonical NTP hydrolase)
MELNNYQSKARETALYPKDQGLVYCALGLTGEAGEVADKIKKIIRDKGGVVSAEDRTALAKELGDVLWYLANLSLELNLALDFVALKNVEKLSSRKNRGVISGSGDNR